MFYNEKLIMKMYESSGRNKYWHFHREVGHKKEKAVTG